MTTVRQLLDQKGRNIWSIHPDATVFDAVAKMAEKDIGSLAVMEGDELVGIITERHYARNVVLKGKASPATPVRDIDRRRRALVGGAPRSFAPSLTLRALLQSLQLSAPKADARLSTPSKEVILVWRHGMDEADGWISRQDWRRGWPCRISRESRHYASL